MGEPAEDFWGIEIPGEDPTKRRNGVLKELIERSNSATIRRGGPDQEAALVDWFALEVVNFVQGSRKQKKKLTAKRVSTLFQGTHKGADVRLEIDGKSLDLSTRVRAVCGDWQNPTLLALQIFNNETNSWVHIAHGKMMVRGDDNRLIVETTRHPSCPG